MAPELVKPRALRAHDRIALVATSWGAGAVLPERFDRGVDALTQLGFEVVAMPHARDGTDGLREWVSASAQQRTDDLHEAFADPSISAILSVIGGDHSAQMLELLDFDVIAANPKIFCGYSDTTTLLHAIHAMTGLVTFYGPALITEFGEPLGPEREVTDHWLEVVGTNEASGNLPQTTWQSGESRMESDRRGENMRRREPEPRRILRAGDASGPLLSGCLPSMLRQAGTRFMPDTAGRVLVLETPEEPYDAQWADADLTQMRNLGVFGEISGLAIGRTDNWPDDDVALLDQLVLDAVRGTDVPVIAGVEVTHSTPTSHRCATSACSTRSPAWRSGGRTTGQMTM